LLSKYSMLGRFYTTQESLDFLRIAVESALDGRGCEPRELAAVFDYLRGVVLHVPFAQTTTERRTWTSSHDVEAWAEAGYTRPLAEFAYGADREQSAECAADTKALILTKVGTFGEHASGLGKFTRTLFARDLRRRPVKDCADDAVSA
jgi:hypothetical protein